MRKQFKKKWRAKIGPAGSFSGGGGGGGSSRCQSAASRVCATYSGRDFLSYRVASHALSLALSSPPLSARSSLSCNPSGCLAEPAPSVVDSTVEGLGPLLPNSLKFDEFFFFGGGGVHPLFLFLTDDTPVGTQLAVVVT